MQQTPGGKKVLIAAAAIAVVAAWIGSYTFLGDSFGPRPAGAMSADAAAELVDEFCVDCHDDITQTANLTLERPDYAGIAHDARMWEPVIRKLRAGMMPPPGNPRPADADYAALRDWLEDEIDSAASPTPGTKVLHRLNRSEYANAIRDLLDLEIDPTQYLPRTIRAAASTISRAR